MLREFKPHLTVVAMESYKTPAAIRAALTASSHVLAEKPACTNAADFRALAAGADGKAPFVTTAESLRAINTLYAAYDSARTGRLTPVR